MQPRVQKFGVVLGAAAATGMASVFALATSPASASPVATAPSSADAAFVTANEQGNLAEIALGTLAGSKAQDAATTHIASMTLSDHMRLKTQLTAVATTIGATLPTAPNSMQKAVAAQLTATPDASFDLMYAQAQVTAHQAALAAARQERDTTADAALKSYAATYITVATPHLTMAQAEVTALGGPPSGAPAGNGGTAATNTTSHGQWQWGIAGGAVLIAAGAGIGVRRRRPTTAQ